MPAPATSEQLFLCLRKSGLVSAAQLEAAIQEAPLGEPPKQLLERLVVQGILTRYQAAMIAEGKYRGFILGPYVILDKLGGGGMGNVFLAEHAAMRRHVALKVLNLGSAENQVARERFFREARVAAGLDHPNIVRVFDFRTEASICYLVMEYIVGENLHTIVKRHGPIDPARAVDYAHQVALGLQYAHDSGLVHRDIKPGNLLLNPEGCVKIIDLGLARWDAEADSQLTAKLDQSILGTADYVAPEQAVNSAQVDIRADIYSLGASLYFLLAGRPMFPQGKTAQKLIFQQLKQPQPIRELAPSVSLALAEVVHRCLAKSPADRFATPAELAEALAACGEPPPALPEPAWFSRPHAVASALKSHASVRRPGRDSVTTRVQTAGHSSSVLPATKKDSHSSAQLPTLSEHNSDTPRPITKHSSPLASRIYMPQAQLETQERAAQQHTASPPPTFLRHMPIVWFMAGAVLTLAVVAIMLTWR